MAKSPTVDTKTPEYRRYRRRLDTILKDPEYGAPLVRLTREQQQRVLELVYAGRGREARTLILELDAQRRAGVRLSELRRKAAAYLLAVTAPLVPDSARRAKDVIARFHAASEADCRRVLATPLDQIRSYASNQVEGNLMWYK